MIGYRPKGLYTHPTIALTFLLSSLLYFSVVSNSKKKLLIVLFTSLTLLFAGTNLVFNRVIYESNIDNTRKVQVSVGGLLACGEIIHITETRFILFDKEIDKNTGLCLRGIERIELRKSRGLERIFEIYHDGTMDSENPYVFTHIK
ncbi:hypothetical protein [Roseivirga pacifica]|uniref:hypothetical protein n=1 Tax=Roseivirga pacifica TaxID=1267423 RepID=UPI003BB1131A